MQGQQGKVTTNARIERNRDMQITRQADYAARAVLHLARVGNNGNVSTGYIAKKQNIPPAFLPKIVSQLSIAGILRTSRGARGGIRLAREPKNISLLEVIEAIDGPIQLNECVRGEGECLFEESCSMRAVWGDIQDEMVAKLRNTNFDHLIR
jgi:Rrf2 family protein